MSTFGAVYQNMEREDAELVTHGSACAVCLDPVVFGDTEEYVTFFECDTCHKPMHLKCMYIWYTKRRHQRQPFTCPSCRSVVPQEDINVLLIETTVKNTKTCLKENALLKEENKNLKEENVSLKEKVAHLTNTVTELQFTVGQLMQKVETLVAEVRLLKQAKTA